MKQVNKFIGLVLLLVVVVVMPVRCQDVQYILNTRTGKFDAVRSAKFVQDNAGNLAFNGNRAVTRSGLPAINTGDTTLIAWLNNYFFPSTSPVVTLALDDYSMEFETAGASYTWYTLHTITRPVACTTITSITINGTQIAIDNPFNEGHVQTGSAPITVPRNTNSTHTIIATAQDGKTGTASRTVTWYWKRYWGSFISAVPPTDPSFTITDDDILYNLDPAGITPGNELSTTRVKTYNGINAAGNYLVFAFPSSWGTPVFVINGLISTAFTRVRNNSFTNASGGSTTYQVWVSNTTQAGAIAQFQIQ
jgi:hypothetical protein